MFGLIQILLSLPFYDLIVIQNPPCLPVIIASIFIDLIRKFTNLFTAINKRTKILIDWHNLGFKMFEEKNRSNSLIVMFSKLLEYKLCSYASHHICVSNAFRLYLEENFNINPIVLYDRPANIFLNSKIKTNKNNIIKRHKLLLKLNFTNELLFKINRKSNKSIEETIQTCYDNNHGKVTIINNFNRTALIISSTSWTTDEDFDLLLDAMIGIENFLSVDKRQLNLVFSRILMIITGNCYY